MDEVDKKNKTRRQHYVPDSYLQRFTSKEQIYVFDLVEQKKYTTSPKKIANIRDFYSLDVEDKSNKNCVEDYFGVVEGRVMQILDSWIRTMKLPSLKEGHCVAEFIAGMHLRVPEMRRKFLELHQYNADLLIHRNFSNKEAYERTCKQYYRDTGKKIEIEYEQIKDSVDNPSHYTIALHQNKYICSMVNLIPKITDLIFRMTPHLLIATGKSRFITTDNPVVLVDTNNNRPSYPGYAWQTETVNAFFPISPTVCFALTWGGKYQVLPYNDISVSIVNSYLMWFSTRYVFSKSDDIHWHKDGKINLDNDKLFDHFSPSKKEGNSSMISGPIPQVKRPFDLNMIRKSSF